MEELREITNKQLKEMINDKQNIIHSIFTEQIKNKEEYLRLCEAESLIAKELLSNQDCCKVLATQFEDENEILADLIEELNSRMENQIVVMNYSELEDAGQIVFDWSGM